MCGISCEHFPIDKAHTRKFKGSLFFFDDLIVLHNIEVKRIKVLRNRIRSMSEHQNFFQMNMHAHT